MSVQESQIKILSMPEQEQASPNQNLSMEEGAGMAEDRRGSFDQFDLQPASLKISAHWLVVNLLLLVLLVGQFAHAYRTELSMTYPSLRPLLENYCQLIQCKIELPRHLALLSLEFSDLRINPSHEPEVVMLFAIIRNLAPFPQELPALALTLTDFDEQVLASRILTLDDCLDPESEKTIFKANSEISIQCYLDTRELNATGYKLELIYP